jgi:hypothetical protein
VRPSRDVTIPAALCCAVSACNPQNTSAATAGAPRTIQRTRTRECYPIPSATAAPTRAIMVP